MEPNFNFITAGYGVKFPEIYAISNLEEARRDGRVVVDVRRVGYDSTVVGGRYVYMLIGNYAEKIPHVNYEDPRWVLMDAGRYSWTDVDAESMRFVVSKGSVLSDVDEESRDGEWEQICGGQRALYFMVVERIDRSYAGLTELFVAPVGSGMAESVVGFSTKNAVVNDRWYNEGGIVWSSPIHNVLRVTIDLAQRIESGQYRPSQRVVWVTAMENNRCILYALDYWTGRTLARREISQGGIPVNALAVNPKDGTVWYVLAGSGNVTVVSAKLNRSVGTISFVVSRTISSPNGKYTQMYPIFPSNMSAVETGSRITGGKVCLGPDTDSARLDIAGSTALWFTFVANSETTVSMKMSSPYTLRWADRSHFGSWHGVNFTFGPFRYNYGSGQKDSYRRGQEYGVDPNTKNVQGICCGILGGVFVNGHPYYHFDNRIMVDRTFKGYYMNNTHPCGKVFASKNVYYPSYVIDPSTGGYQMANGKPVVVRKKISQVGHPINGFYLSFDDDHTDDGWKVVEYECGGNTKGKYPLGRDCRFGNPAKSGPAVSNAVATANFSGASKAELKTGNTSWGERSSHMVESTETLHEESGTFWWQLQDAGIIYGANAALTRTRETEYTSGVSSAFPYATSFFFSTGVCEDNPLQLSGCLLPDQTKRTWYDHRSSAKSNSSTGTTGYVTNNTVFGFTYQKEIVLNRSDATAFFDSISPGIHYCQNRPFSNDNGWSGWVSRPTSPYLYGSTEDWGISKVGYNPNGKRGNMVAYAAARKPRPPRMSMRGLDETLPLYGELDAWGSGRHIVQSDSYDNGGAVYSVEYGSRTFMPGNSISNLTLAATMRPHQYHTLGNACDNVTIDDANRIYIGGNGRVHEYDNFIDQNQLRYHNRFACGQFTSLGNHNNTGSRWHEAVQMSAGRAMTRREAEGIASNDISGVVAHFSYGPLYKQKGGAQMPTFCSSTGNIGRMNCDQTGMDSVKTLGYCFTLKTAAHPEIVYPSGHLLIVERPRAMDTGACDVGSGYWDKSVLLPTFLDDVEDGLVRSHIANAVNPRREDAYEIAVSTFGTSAAAYQMSTTKHILDVCPSGSMVVRYGTLKFYDGGEQNRTSVKLERGVDIPLAAGDGGYFAIYEDPVGWRGVTVFGKPISTSASVVVDKGVAVHKFYREGQLTPSGDVFGMYPNVRPNLFTRSYNTVVNSEVDDTWAGNNVGGSGFVEPNRVEFWVKLAGDVYSDDVVKERTDVCFGVNYVHAYERWSSPGFCPYMSYPESGKELFGDC